MALAWNIRAPTGTLSTFFFNPVFQLSTAKNKINLFNNHVLIVAPVTFAPAGAITPSAEFLLLLPRFPEIQIFHSNSEDSDQTPHIAASDLGLHCLPMSL